MRGFLIFIGGVVVIVVGWAAAVYVGVWLMFIGGIVQAIEGAKMDPVSSMDIAVGIARVVLCELAVVIGLVGTFVGGTICGLGAMPTGYKSGTLADAKASMRARTQAKFSRRP